eukprot:Gb_27268 [translate_table: standard]
MLVKTIPRRFTSLEEYLGSFVWPLIEELRAGLQSNLESVSQAPHAAVTFQEEIKPSQGAVKTYKILIDREYDAKQREEQNIINLRPKDIIVLSTILPENRRDFHKDCKLVSVSKTNGDDTELLSLEVKVYVSDTNVFNIKLNKEKKNWFAIYLGNIITDLRIWNSLHPDLGDRKFNSAIIYEALYSRTEVIWTNLLMTVSAVQKNEPPYIKLIQGPPGTGKTSMLISLLSILLHMQKKVLVCAPTNIAISEVAKRFLKLVIAPSDQCPNADSCIVNLSNIVLVGNDERLDVEGPLGNIFLPYRVDRLMKCLMPPLTGWRHKVISLLNFLESPLQQDEAFIETRQQIDVSFGQFLRQRLEELAMAVVESARILLNDLPSTISDKRQLEGLTEHVQSLVNLIENNEVDDMILKEWFSDSGEGLRDVSKDEKILSHTQVIDKKLRRAICLKRSQCIQFLRDQCMNLAEPFNCLIIDEAAQLKEAEATIVMQIKGLTHAFFTGDPQQLTATVFSKLAESAGYARSLFERLKALGHPMHLLNIQYRMHPSISRFPNMMFYDNRIIDASSVQQEFYGKAYLEQQMYGSYAFINIADGREETDESGPSKRNLVEASVVLYILSKLYRGKPFLQVILDSFKCARLQSR